jgi:hypothetical protein
MDFRVQNGETKMKHLRLTFEDQEFEELVKAKGGLTWHDLVMTLPTALTRHSMNKATATLLIVALDPETWNGDREQHNKIKKVIRDVLIDWFKDEDKADYVIEKAEICIKQGKEIIEIQKL